MRCLPLLVLVLAACGKSPTPPTPVAATATAPVTAAPADQPDVIITETTPDPARMPNDPVHAGMQPARPADPHGADPHGGMAPMRPAMGTTDPAETGVDLPLPLIGAGSIAELRARLALITDQSKHAPLEEAFRKLFTVDRGARDGARAKAILEPLAADPDPKVASLVLRMLAYVALNSGFDAATATARYEQALALDPDYGEAHYALAFVLAISDLDKGKVHFDKAKSLGVPDTRGLEGQFYKDGAHP